MHRSRSGRSLLLAACAAASLGLCGAASANPATETLDGTKAPGTTKESPYAAAKDETKEGADKDTATPTEALGGTKAPGTTKESPYASAKDETDPTLEPTLGKLWGLLLPVGLAAGSYVFLRSKEKAGRA
ncbi:MAG: hypothetical protein VKM01_01025 [Cyanobacteriota bacterium]|jgi:hypothetical protein|nr:hypothetical protein [Cyanobacteriota bacterium]